MIKNNKGFVITEVLILSIVIIGVLVFMYSQFKNINRSYQYSFKYDTVEGMYLANNIVNYINENIYDQLVEQLVNTQTNYIDITECDPLQFETCTFIDELLEKSEVEQIIFTEENLAKLKTNPNDLDNDMKNYIKQIKVNNAVNDHRIIVKYTNETFATMRFNKGNTYVQKGLIVHLDAINNTGGGHSNETQTWIDLSGHENDATLYNNPAWTNNSLITDGQTNYGKLENTANMEYTNGLTWEARLKVLSLLGLKENGNINIFGNWNSGGGGIYFNNPNKILANVRLNGSYIATTNTTNNIIGQYYTITTTYDNNNLKLYIDGQYISSVPNNNTYDISILPLTIGGKPDTNPALLSNYANVEFQNILIYNRALTENEVLRNYQADIARY